MWIHDIFQLLLLWALLAASVVVVATALRARRTELEEGLPPAKTRVVATASAAGVVTLLVLLATWSTFAPSPTVEPESETTTTAAPPAPVDPATTARIEDLIARRRAAIDEADRLEEEIETLRPSRVRDTSSAPPSSFWRNLPDFRTLAWLLSPMLLIASVILLFTTGDPAVLMRAGLFRRAADRGERVTGAVADLNALAAAADAGWFREGLDRARAIEVDLLDPFDRLDHAFFKSYCAVQLAATEKLDEAERKSLLQAAARDLATLLEQAPNRGEAVYLLAMAHGWLGEQQAGLDHFARARVLLGPQGSGLPLAKNESVCLLKLAEETLGKGDVEGASHLFDRVAALGVLKENIPSALVKIRLSNVRKALNAGRYDEAAQGIVVVRGVEGLDADQRWNMDAICAALEAVIAVRSGEDDRAVARIAAFLEKHMPTGLPEPDDEIADEYLESPLAGVELRLNPQIFPVFLFLQAEAAAKAAARRGNVPSPSDIREIARPILRAFLFELRQRDLLASLGGLYYWFVPEKRKKALQWLEAAAAMGVVGRIARQILEAARMIELENREALEWFRSASGRFLNDPTVTAQVRRALVEELGRFQEFSPMLLDLEAAPDLEPREPTIRLLRERSGYLQKMIADLAMRKSDGVGPQLTVLRDEYARLIAGLDSAAARMAEVERKLVQEVGKTVLS
jgi:hypothetical protein